MIRFFFIFAFVLGSAQAANATICTIPTTLVNGSIVDASQLNGNFTSLQSCGNAIDNTNIGANGIFASQMKPTSLAQASFGGTFAYTFGVAPRMSGASITAGTIPNSALVSGGAGGVTSVTGSGNIASSGGLTPNIKLVAAPSISGVNFTSATVPNAALVTTPLTALTAGTNISITGAAPNLTISAAGGATGVTSVTASGNLASSGGTTPNITINSVPTFNQVISNAYFLGGQANQTLNTDGTTVYLHSVGGSISFVNAANNAFAPVTALSFNGNAYYFGGQGNPVLDILGGATVIHATGGVASVAVLAATGGAYTSIQASAFTVSSDRRLKRDITPYTRGLDTIMALRPVRFVLRSDSKKSMGFIAQDVQKVLPELVTSGKLKGKVTLGVNYSAIVAPLVAAVQEQQRQIVELRAEVKALRQAK